jgi:hypothetical protein
MVLPLCSFAFAASNGFGENIKIDHHWSLLTEWIYMTQRAGINSKLVADTSKYSSDSYATAIGSKDLVDHFGFVQGGRVGLSYTTNHKYSYESRFMYLTPWFESQTLHKPSSLIFPFDYLPFTQDFYVSDNAKAYYKSQFYTFDINYLRHSARRGVDYFVMSGVFGLRFYELHEKAGLKFFDDGFSNFAKINYRSKTLNDCIGMQGGFNFQMNPYDHFSFDCLALAGLGLNRAYANVKLNQLLNTIALKKYQKQHSQSSVFVDLELKIGYQVVSSFNLHAGYQLFYFTGIAQAPNQMSRKAYPFKNVLYKHSDVLLHGLMVGCNFDF